MGHPSGTPEMHGGLTPTQNQIPVTKPFTGVAVGMGSNRGDRFRHLVTAARELRDLPESRGFKFSRIYESEPVNCRDPFKFLNAAAYFETRIQPHDLLKMLMKLEQRAGRERPYPNAPRSLDLDLLFFRDLVVRDEVLTLPHPRMANRLFVLTPLAEVWKDHLHPLEGISVAHLEQRCLREAAAADVIWKYHRQWSAEL